MNKKATKIFSSMAIISCIAISITSCGKKNENSPGVEFMPDMYRTVALEPNMGYEKLGTTDTFQVNRLPVAGTISRGNTLYAYANDTAGYANAGRFLHNPLLKNEQNLKEGEILFGKFCESCHGKTGAGDGLVGSKLPGPPPAYSTLKNLPEGKMFHSITYGKGLMGSHASQLTKDERWKLVMYVQKLQFPDGAAPEELTAVPVKKEEAATTEIAK